MLLAPGLQHDKSHPEIVMPICVAVPKETRPGEHRVALVPQIVERLAEPGIEVLLEAGAGDGAFSRTQTMSLPKSLQTGPAC